MEKSFKKFSLIWFGQFVSIIGSGISSFGLSVWILYETGSATPFAMSCLCSILPSILFAPIAGSFADRKKRKTIIMLADSFDALLKVVMIALLSTNVMQVWMIYPIMFLSATFSTFQSAAFSAALPTLVDESKLSKANGMLQTSSAISSLVSPVVAGALYQLLKLQGLLAIDFITFFFALITIACVAFPELQVSEEDEKVSAKVVFSDFKNTWGYLKKIENLIVIVLVFAVLNFMANITLCLLGPLVLSLYDSTMYGVIQMVNGVAMIAGGLLASVMPDVKHKIKVMFLVLVFSGVGLAVVGLNPSWMCIAAGIFVFFVLVPYANTLFRTVLQLRIEKEMMGRSFSLIGALLQIVTPVAYVIAGPLADYVFEPFMAADGAGGMSFIGTVIGSGEGRGYGLMFIVAGLILICICVAGAIGTKEIKATEEGTLAE